MPRGLPPTFHSPREDRDATHLQIWDWLEWSQDLEPWLDQWFDDFDTITSLFTSHYIMPSWFRKLKTTELHHFSVASCTRYGWCPYSMILNCSNDGQSMCCSDWPQSLPWENKWSPWAHGELTETTVVTAPGPNDHSSVTARRGHSSVTARSRLGHTSVTARSQLNHTIFSMIMTQSRLGHSSITAQVTAQSRLAVTILVTVSLRWAHSELTMSSHCGQFFSHGLVWC